MSKQTINIGASPNDGTGTPLRTSFDYTNQNFTELYTALGGGVGLPGATTQVIFNDGGTNLAGDAGLVYNKTTDALTVAGLVTAGSATITGDLTVDTSTLKVDSANNRVGIGTASPGAGYVLDVVGAARITAANGLVIDKAGAGFVDFFNSGNSGANVGTSGTGGLTIYTANGIGGSYGVRYVIDSTGISTWSVAGTTAMTLNSTGLGIGVSPATKLDVLSAAAEGTIRLTSTIDGSNASPKASSLSLRSGSSSVETARIASFNRFSNVGGGDLVFSTADTSAVLQTRATIDSSGNVGIGVTPTTSRLLIKGNGTNIPVKIVGTTGDTTIPHLVIDKKDNNTTTSQLFIQFVINDNNDGSGQINANGVNQAAFGTYSDSRLKKNIVSLPSQLANILSLRPVEFDYKDGNGHQIGFIAQEMQEVYADAVGEQEGFLTVSGWNKTEARLVSAIQELAAKVQALEAKLA